jgi:trehalose synthase
MGVEFFGSILQEKSLEEMREVAVRLRQQLDGRVIWNVNSRAEGGDVAETLHTLLGYARGAGVDTRLLVLGGDSDFRHVTRRLRHALHGDAGDGSPLDDQARRIYQHALDRNAEQMETFIAPQDVVILHDPPTAGLIPRLVERGNSVVWRCHMGLDTPNRQSDRGWSFLEPWLTRAQAFVFSRFNHLPDQLYHGRCLVQPPSIDPFSAKNQDLDIKTVHAILARIGILDGKGDGEACAVNLPDGTRITVHRPAEILREGPPPACDTPLVVQISRWDSFKDPVGALYGFHRSVDRWDTDPAHLVLAGPALAGQDPDEVEVFREVVAAWRSLPEESRRRVHLVRLPMEDVQENAAMVNALQRQARVVVQKSLREGFGLTVTEALWKARPVIASALGGMQDQIEHGVSGLLLRDPSDLDAFAGAIRQVLANPSLARRLGENGRRRVARNYLGSSILARYADLVERLDLEPPVA